MLLSNDIHKIIITSRNINTWTYVLGYKPPLGENDVTSYQILIGNYKKTPLRFSCDECGVEFVKSVRTINTGRYAPMHYCNSCINSKHSKESWDTIKTDPDAYGARCAATRDAIANHPELDQIKRRRSEGIHRGNVNNPKYLDDTYHRKSEHIITVSCDVCSCEYEMKYRYAIKNTILRCDRCIEIQRGKSVSSTMKGVPRPKWRRENSPRWKPDTDEYKQYKKLVYSYTAENKTTYQCWDNFDKIGLCGVDGAYQLDHIIPIRYGFDNNICPSLIGSIHNLQIIPWEENLKKSNQMELSEQTKTVFSKLNLEVPIWN